MYRDLATDEDLSRTKAAGATDMKVFGALVGNATIYAIDKLRTEWSSVLHTIANQETLGSCDCEILHRYSLPCKHYLYQVAQQGIQIPRSLLHPRWWLSGPVIRGGAWGEKAWRPLYIEAEGRSLPISPKRKDVYRIMAEVFEQRERLSTEEKSRFDDQILAASDRLKAAGIQHEQLAALPIGQPDPIPKKSWRKKNTHGRANARALTAAEAADRDLRAQDRQNKKLRAAAPGNVLEEDAQVPVTPEQEPPVSTAPARLAGAQEADGRGKRKRTVTEAYRQARQAGLQSLGYSQVE